MARDLKCPNHMSVVCGIDFSPSSLRAAAIAARLAAKWGGGLHLAHVVDIQEEPLFGRAREEMVAASTMALEREATRLRAECGVTTDSHLLSGKPDEALAHLAQTVGADLVVISALGARAESHWQVGGSADRITQLTTCPVLVVREGESIHAWLEGKRALKAIVAVDRTPRSEHALQFARKLRQVGAVDLTALHLYWASDEYRRLGFGGVRSIVDPDPDVERILHRELAEDVGTIPGEGKTQLQVELCLGRPSDRIADIAARANADLVVVGSHRRNLLDRVWNGSTSRGVLHHAKSSVAVVTSIETLEQRPIPEIRSVMVATDFSETGDAAVRWAYSLVKQGGTVHLVHVHTPDDYREPMGPRDILEGPDTAQEKARKEADERRLKLREPVQARERGIITQVVALASPKVSTALIQAAERLGVDAVVLGTHGRSGIARTVLGSVAQEVGARCGRPVLMVHPSSR